jgi:aminopeptidase N
MRRLVLLPWIALAAVGCGGDSLPTGPAQVEVVRYGYRFDIETRQAAAELSLRIVEAGDCVTLPVRASGLIAVEFDGDRMKSGEITDGAMIACGRGWEAGDEVAMTTEVEVALETWGDSQVGYSVSTDIEGAPFHYMVSWIGGCDRFGPCDSTPGRFAEYDFTVTHPAGTQVLCSGALTAGDTETRCEFSHDGGPTYSTFGLVASPSWDATDLGDWDGVRVSLYDMPSTGIATDLDVDQHAAFVAWMQDTFGPYPFGDELRLITGPTYWNGFEHPGNITLNDRLNVTRSLYADGLAHTINHELAHQWAGDQTTLTTTYDFVWKEAMAEYLTFVFEDEQLDGNAGFLTAAAWKQFSSAAEFYPVPGEQPQLLDYYGDVYGPGPMILFRQIEALFSREHVIAALKTVLGQERAIGMTDVQAALEESTGADLSGYFDAWIYGEGAPVWPRFQVSAAPTANPGEVAVTVRQENVEQGLYGCAFAIELRGLEEGQIHELWFDLGVDGNPELTVNATPGFDIDRWVFDARRTTLALEAIPQATDAAPIRRNPWVAGDWR